MKGVVLGRGCTLSLQLCTIVSNFFNGKGLIETTLSVEVFACGDTVNAEILTNNPKLNVAF